MAKQLCRLRLDVPQHYQLRVDNACGPYVILMVADFLYQKGRGRNLYAGEWSKVLKTTMQNDLTRRDGTSYEDLVKALKDLQLSVSKIKSKNDDLRCEAIREVLRRDNPIIVGCKIPYGGKLHKHYAILVRMGDEHFYFRDPFPYTRIKNGSLKKVLRKTFLKKNPGPRDTAWGRHRWAVDVSFSKTGHK
jgi:hypothetical protein